MRHADDGTLSALLDGALATEEAGALRAHLLLCADCRRRLEDARTLRDQAESLLASGLPAFAPPPPFEELARRAAALPAGFAHQPLRAPRTGLRLRNLAWAATVVLALAGGWWGRGYLQPAASTLTESGRMVAAAAPASTPAPGVRSPAPAARPAPTAAAPTLARGGYETLTQPAERERKWSGAPAGAAGRAPSAPVAANAANAADAAGAAAREQPTAAQTRLSAAPTVIPPDIPPPSIATRESDFTGAAGAAQAKALSGHAAGSFVTAENVEAAPTFTPYTVAPQISNREEVRRALVGAYPQQLKDAGLGGTTMVWLLIDETGAVRRTQVKVTSGSGLLDNAALQVAGLMRFSPGLNRDKPVKVWVALPIIFKTSP